MATASSAASFTPLAAAPTVLTRGSGHELHTASAKRVSDASYAQPMYWISSGRRTKSRFAASSPSAMAAMAAPNATPGKRRAIASGTSQRKGRLARAVEAWKSSRARSSRSDVASAVAQSSRSIHSV